MEVTGQIHSIGQVQQITDNFSKREVIVITEATTPYPQHIKLETSNAKNSLLDAYKVGDNVKVQFNLQGRIHKETAFNTLSIWKIESNF